MPTFTPLFGNQLYGAVVPIGEFLLVLPQPANAAEITLEEAWSSQELAASFVYCAKGTGVDAASASEFVAAMLKRPPNGTNRGFVWLTDPAAWRTGQLNSATAPVMGLRPDGSGNYTLNALLYPGCEFLVGPCNAGFDGALVQFSGSKIYFNGVRAPVPTIAPIEVTLFLDGPNVGVFSFSYPCVRSSLLNNAHWGFQLVDARRRDAWFPLAEGTGDPITFDVTIDPSNPDNAIVGGTRTTRTRFAFTSADELVSGYRTREGKPIVLRPETAELVFNSGVDGRFQLAPSGDFALWVGYNVTAGELLCGLQGTEAIGFQAGQRLRFEPYREAYAPTYPFAEVSPVVPQGDLSAALLDGTYTTSWAAVVGEGPIDYVAQPRGGSLYGSSTTIGGDLFGWVDTAGPLPAGVTVPLFPYALAPRTEFPEQDVEWQVVAPTRRTLIGSLRQPEASEAAQPITTTTATGQVVTVENGVWTRITLGQTADPKYAMEFHHPSPELQQAFQTSELFLVAANATKLGTLVTDGKPPVNQASFTNTIEIGGWRLSANVGARNRYGDYRNVLIVKGRKGKLYDGNDSAASLVANPQRWTQQNVFGAPSDLPSGRRGPVDEPGPPNQREVVILSQWLQDYFAQAAKAGGTDLERFNAIAADPDWTGILILRVDITRVPDDLIGILAGITDPDAFQAHHLGIEVSPVTRAGLGGPQQSGQSSMFGLITYTDPAFSLPRTDKLLRPVRPAVGTEYEFRMLSLRVRFANTAVRSFQSYAQLTTTSWFDMPVDHMGTGGNPYSAILLTGSLQTNDDQPVYSLASTSDATFFFDHDVVSKLEITSVVMSTRNVGEELVKDREEPPLAGSWFALTGFLDFKLVHAEAGEDDVYPLDVFSFGTAADEPVEQPRRGLAFANLGILMTFPPDDPSDSLMALDAGEILFDLATSTAREGSLFRQFALDVRGLVSGDLRNPPARAGYTAVATPARLNGVAGSTWWGIDFQLPLGSAGNLAGKAGLTAHLLTAWAPGRRGGRLAGRKAEGYSAMLAVLLPGSGGGAGLISLQTVLRLSVGQLFLRYDRERSAFLLVFGEIALRVLGLGKLPPGTSTAILYGDPHGTGSPSGLGWYAVYQREELGA